MDLAITFIEQCSPPTESKSQQINDRTKRYISIVTKIAFKSNFTLEEIETKFPIPFQKHIILGNLLRKRKHSGVQGIVHTSSLDKLSEIDLSKIDNTNDKSFEALASSYIEIIYHRWIIRSISKRVPLWFIKSPSLEGTESFDLVQLGEESLKSLEKLVISAEKNPNIFDNLIDKPSSLDKSLFSMALILDMANYYFFREDFQNSFKYLGSLHEQLTKHTDKNIESLKENCDTLIIACQSVIMASKPSEGLLLPEHKKTLFFRQIDEIVKSLNNQLSEEDKEKTSRLLIDLLIQDIIENQLSREYRVSLCYKLIEKENIFKKILACNIIQDMIKIIQGHAIQQDLENAGLFDLSSANEKSKHSIIPDHEGVNISAQNHLDRYVLKHKFVTSQPIIPVYIIVFLKKLELESKKYIGEGFNPPIWDSNMTSIISDFVCRLAKYVNHPIVYATLLSEGETYLSSTEENIDIFESLMLESVEKTYHLCNFQNISSLEYQEHNYVLLPENVQHKLLLACSEKKTQNSSYFQNLKSSIVKKRVYDSAIKASHVLFSDDLEEVLKHESASFEPLKRLKTETSDYMSLRGRNILYRNCFKSPILTHKAKSFLDISITINRFKNMGTSKRIEFDKILISLSQKSANLMIEEYSSPRIESKQIERPSPYIDCMEEFSTLCELCNLQKSTATDTININEKPKADLSHINLVFLGELFKNLINLGDWAFIRDFFKQVYEQNTSSDDENVHTVFCRFAILVESLAYHIHAPRNGAPKKVFKDLKDDIYKFVHNLIYLPDQYHYETDSLNFEDENRLRWDDFHLLVSTNNLKFLMDLAVMLAFVLVSVRMTVVGNRSTSPPVLRNQIQPTITGHYKQLAKLIMPEYFCSSTKKHWLLGNEKFVEDTLVIMLQHVLERVVNLQEQSSTKAISTFYLFKCCLADVYFEKGKFKRALELYLECGEMNFPHFYKPANEEVVERMFRCLVELGEYTAAAVLHQFVHSTYDNEIESQSRTHVISDNFINTNNRIGYSKEIIDNFYESNGLNERWLMYFYDLSYLELVVHIAHQKGEFSKEDLIIQHIQRSEINSNNKTEHRKEYIQVMKETFLRRLYLHVTTFLKN